MHEVYKPLLAGAIVYWILRHFQEWEFYTVKPGVIIAFAPPMARVQPLIARAHYECDIGRGPVITSGIEGEHVPGSFHPLGLAGDYRTKDLTSWQASCLIGRTRKLLGPAYQVIEEYSPPHMHVEYDPNG